MPSKRIIYLLSLCIVLVALIISVSIFVESRPETVETGLSANSNNISVSRSINTSSEQDSNNNQIPDWLETIDTESVESEYVPGEVDMNSLSSQLAKTIFSNYTEAKNTGEIDDTAKTQIIEDALSQVSYNPNLTGIYTAENIVKVEENDENIRKYANDFINILLDESQKYTASQDNDNLDRTSNTYKNIVMRMSTLPTPNGLTSTQADIANTYYVMSNLFVDIGKYKNDPVQSLLSYRTLQQVGLKQLEILGKIKIFIKQSGIIFNENEPGSALVR